MKILKNLKKLDMEFSEKFKKYSGKTIFVPHEAFGYMIKEYHFEQEGIEGLNSDSEPNVTRMREIIEEMNKKGVKTVFYEFGKSDKVAKIIAKEVGGNVKPISTLEVLSEEEISKGSDYISLMRMNLNNIIDSFEGK